MNPEVLLRLVWALGIVAAGLLGYAAYNRFLLVRSRSRRSGLEESRPGLPVLLYFTTPTCVPCKTVQRPAIQQLKDSLGESLQVVEIDAASRPEVADQWGVMSVPTTYIIDSKGQPRYVNHGVAQYDKLSRQLASINIGG